MKSRFSLIDRRDRIQTEADALLRVVIDLMVADAETSSDDVAFVLMRVQRLQNKGRKITGRLENQR